MLKNHEQQHTLGDCTGLELRQTRKPEERRGPSRSSAVVRLSETGIFPSAAAAMANRLHQSLLHAGDVRQ